jgi:hypothetical protein
MATVLVSVALVAASIWIAIRMESGPHSPGRCAVPSVHPRAGPGCATRSRPGRTRAVAMIAARHRSPSAPT